MKGGEIKAVLCERVSVKVTRLAVLVCSTVAAPGCGYLQDRALDVTDLIDIKYGGGWGLGAKAEATMLVGAGFGLADVRPQREWYGRRSRSVDYAGGFFHLGLLGFDGYSGPCGGPDSALHLLTLNPTGYLEPGYLSLIDRFRFGGELLLVYPVFGAYLNAGELVDLLCGFAGLDPAGDDGVGKTELLGPGSIPDSHRRDAPGIQRRT